ncbi:hypothetical protein O6H91_08G044000 [Diphasiastrum complanatum]|uniref:Uncharacterized protein n=1 Tax=Diphasiastrum complanatum TaxID=34168 RepID=A0ACC2CXC2_DIPCM|nr:hypothetical protein O6H91_08G044000 [Diphasiastrum complanatum]
MFYDLNIVYDGVKEHSRREMLAMAMQMGYSGIASNHVVVGLMADSDRCRICPLPVSAIISASPGVAEAAKFHREVLGVPVGQPFRQYSRLTIVIEDQVQAAALNAANPVLRTYDLVAVQPTNQKMLGQACNHLEVDLITLNFTEKPSFRLKLPMIKAAIERGIYFEISYGAALMDIKARRELFTNIKILIGWTRGRNIVVSSRAKRALELRGPNDVANLASMFGLTREHAKAAVSKNCKSALLHGVARKRAHKAAIIVDRLPPNSDHKPLFNVPKVWDPLSSGVGDCLLFEDSKHLEQNLLFGDKSGTDSRSITENQQATDMETSNDENGLLFAPLRKPGITVNDVETPKAEQIEKKRKVARNKPIAVRMSPRTIGRKRARQ